MNINEAGRDDAPRGVDIAGRCGSPKVAHRDDAVAGDGNIRRSPNFARPIDDRTVPDGDVATRWRPFVHVMLPISCRR
jgi:hypothetical protein